VHTDSKNVVRDCLPELLTILVTIPNLGETGIRILTRMMGLLHTAIAVQFILNGLTDIGLVKRSP